MEVPAATPVTTPVEEVIVATPVAELLHVPPVAVLPSVVVSPAQTLCVPEIAGPFVLTVTMVEAVHPEKEYEIAEVPTAIPDTIPPAFTDATEALDVVQAPPDGLEISVELVATQIALVPVMGEGSGLTVTVRVAGRQLPNV